MTDSDSEGIAAGGGNLIDREDALRTRPALFDELHDDPATRVLPIWDGRILLRPDGALDVRGQDEVTAALSRVYLGRALHRDGAIEPGARVVASVLTEAAALELEPETSRWRGLRGALGSLGAVETVLAFEAVGITNWHTAGAFCPRCGMPTLVERAGWTRRCLECDRELFPRSDPAVIVAVVDERERLLLGANAAWESGRWSVLAGFVEPGESLEAAVRREVFEETAIAVGPLGYFGSQPWPFPASLMVGFRARLTDSREATTPRVDGEELVDARWFTRRELWEARDRIRLPPSATIAGRLIEDWYGGRLDAPPAGPRR